MFARLFCGDLFVHGIGGGNYDRLTDEIIRRFFGFEPPQYMVVSGTLRLPLRQSSVRLEDLRALDVQIRDLIFNPDRYLRQNQKVSESAACQTWIEEKTKWIKTPLTPENGPDRHRAIERCNQRLQPFVREAAVALRTRRSELAEKLHADRVLADRNYAFCLFPEPLLREFVLDSVGRAL